MERLEDLKESIKEMIEEADLSPTQVKRLKIRIIQAIYDHNLRYLRTDEKEITAIELDPDKEEIVLSVANKMP